MAEIIIMESQGWIKIILILCGGTGFERRGLDLSDKRGLLDFWRRMKMKLAAVT